MKIDKIGTLKYAAIVLTILLTLICATSLSINACYTGTSHIDVIFKIPHYLEVSEVADTPLLCGPYFLKANKDYTLTVAWKEEGEQVIEMQSSEYGNVSQYVVRSGHPYIFRVETDGLYRIRIPGNTDMSDIIYVLQETPM